MPKLGHNADGPRGVWNRLLSDRGGFAELAIYLLLSILFFGRGLIGHLATFNLGQSKDPGFYMWCLLWLPYAISHRINPFFTDLIWAPGGVSLAWTTFIPLVALAAYPMTATLGPIVTYNILCLIAPALAGWSTFILCRYLTKRYWPSLVGGYLFGFSPYMAGQMNTHLVLVLIFPIPLAAYLVVRRANSELGRRPFAILLALVLVAQFLIALETFATMTFFGGVAMLLALAIAKGELRRRVYSTLQDVAVAYGLVAIVLSPYFYYLFAFGVPSGSPYPTDIFSADLLNFLIPTPANLAGQLDWFARITGEFTGNLGEATAYLSPGLVFIAAAFAYSHRRDFSGALLAGWLLIICVASMGVVLHVDGQKMLPLPWALVSHLPLIDKALPARFTLFAFLDLAVIAALWLSDAPPHSIFRPAVILATILLMLPNLDARAWVNPVDLPVFFSSGLYRQYLREGELVLLLPTEGNDSMLWQAASGMYFRMADGYVGPDPVGFTRWEPKEGRALLPFLASHDITAIVLCNQYWNSGRFFGPLSFELVPTSATLWRPYLSPLKVDPVRAGDVLVYRIPTEVLAQYKPAGSCSPAADAALRAGAETPICSFSATPPAKDRPWHAFMEWHAVVANRGSELGRIRCTIGNGTNDLVTAETFLFGNETRTWHLTASASRAGAAFRKNMAQQWTWRCEADRNLTILPTRSSSEISNIALSFRTGDWSPTSALHRRDSDF